MAIKSEHRTDKIRKDNVKKMRRRSDSKNEKTDLEKSGKEWPEKIGRSELEKWGGLIRKVRRTDSKNGKV